MLSNEFLKKLGLDVRENQISESAPPNDRPKEYILPEKTSGQGVQTESTEAQNTYVFQQTEMDKSCFICKSTQWWISIYGPKVCEDCHPPAAEWLVAKRVG